MRGRILGTLSILLVASAAHSQTLYGPGGLIASEERSVTYQCRGFDDFAATASTSAGAPLTVTGKLPIEVVQRIVRAKLSRLRVCYEQGLKKSHDLAGTVFFDFVVDTTGALKSSKLAAGGTLTDPTVTSCVVGVIATLSFPEPDAGTVSVHYGVDFQTW